LKKFIASYFKKRLTLLLVPQEGGKPFHLRVRWPFLHALILLSGAVVLASLWIVSHDRYDARLVAQARRYRDRMADIEKEIEANRQRLTDMGKLDAQMRRTLKIRGSGRAAVEAGVGGPTEEDAEQLTELLEEKDEKLLSKISLGTDSQTQETIKRQASFREIQMQLDRQRALLASTPAIWPVKGWITSGFGKRMSPLTGEPGRHMGVDIANETNTPIRATADGLVTYAGWQAGYGRLVVVEHGYGFSTRYGHCSRVNVRVGQEIKKGQVVGFIGSTGHSTGSHCHYEVRIHGMPVDPMKYLPSLN